METEYQFYKKRGICTMCKKEPARRGKVYCAKCAEKRRKYNRGGGELREPYDIREAL